MTDVSFNPTTVYQHVPISELTTFKNAGVIDTVMQFNNLLALQKYVAEANPFFMLGKGSNTLLDPDSLIKTVVKLTQDFMPVLQQDSQLRVSAGTTVNRLMSLCTTYALSGAEFSAGVPATIGGMITMNFGCWGQSMSDIVARVHVLTSDNKTVWIEGSNMGFGYRTSRIKTDNLIVLEAILNLNVAKKASIKQTILTNIETRLAKQPLRANTFGSIFKNPLGHHAGKVLEDMGYKGKQFGHVALSSEHANFMVNLGGATFKECLDVLHTIQTNVQQHTGILLECEVHQLS